MTFGAHLERILVATPGGGGLGYTARRDARGGQESSRRTIHRFINVPIPIIAAVNDPAVGWGATLATLCDIVLMSENAVMAEPHINIGLVVGDGISVSWPLYASLLRAKELIFNGDRITAPQAVEYGLANRVVPADKLMEEACALAAKVIGQPREALREAKKIMNSYLHVTAAQHLDVTLGRLLAATLSEEHHRIARDFFAKQSRAK